MTECLCRVSVSNRWCGAELFSGVFLWLSLELVVLTRRGAWCCMPVSAALFSSMTSVSSAEPVSNESCDLPCFCPKTSSAVLWMVSFMRFQLCGALQSRTRPRALLNVEVYGLVSGTKRHSPRHTHWPPSHRTCSLISHLNFPGSIQPGCHFRRTELFKHISLHCPTGTYLLLDREIGRVGKVPCLGAQRFNVI